MGDAMTANTFRITFRGEIKQGWEPQEVRKNVAGLFKLDLNNQQHVQKIDRLFSGRSIVIKDNVNKITARAYADAIDKAGGKVYIKIETAQSDRINERRLNLRRQHGDRRTTRRLSTIVPDRRKNSGRRNTDPNK